MRQAHPPPPAPQPPDGCGEEAARGAPAPTNPGLECRFASFSPSQPGQAGFRVEVTNASNSRPQS